MHKLPYPKSILLISLAFNCLPLPALASEQARTDRYTLVALDVPTEQKMPLSTVTSFSLSEDIATVGDAINEILKGSGYRWQSPEDSDALLGKLPLPSVVRRMGPVRIQDALQTFAGQAWNLQYDHLNRVVWFESLPLTTQAHHKE